MMSPVDRLRVLYELDDRRYRDGMRRMEQASRRTNAQILQQAQRAEQGVGRSMDAIVRQSLLAIGGIGSITMAIRKLLAASQSFKIVENRLRSIGEFSDEAGEKLAAAAIRSRAPLEDMATAVARIQKATGDSYDTNIRRVETLNKLLAVGGATAQEVSSVMTQLSQALSSGTLQGDELRSLREAAPIEVLDAIAKAAGVTRGELKKMGEEGLLTTEIMTRALDSLAETADENFGRTAQTIGQAMTNIETGLTTFVGRLDEGLSLTERLTIGLSDMGVWLNDNAAEAEEFGRSLTAALQTGKDIVDDVKAAMDALALAIHEETIGSVVDFGDAFSESGVTAGDVIEAIIQGMAEFSGVMEGSAEACREAFLKVVDGVSAGVEGAINSIITGVEIMIDAVLDGARRIAFVLKLFNPAMDVGGMLDGPFKISSRANFATNMSGRSVAAAYDEGYDRGYQGVQDAVDSVSGFFDGIKERYEANRSELERQDREAETAPPITPSAPGASPSEGGGSKGKKGGRGRKGREDRPFFEAVEQDLLNLEREITLVGKSAEEVARARAEWAMLDEAKKRGITVDAALNRQIEEQAAAVGRLTAELERAEIAQQQFEQAVDGIADAFAGALVAGESLRDGLAQVFKQIAADLMRSGIRNALLSQFGSGAFGMFGLRLAGGGDALTGALRGAGLNAIPSFDGGGRTGNGPRSGGLDGKGGFLALMHPNETVTDHTKKARGGGMSITFAPQMQATGAVSHTDMAMYMQSMQKFMDEQFVPALQKHFPDYDQRYR